MGKIMITGAAGYIGSSLAQFLIKHKFEVVLIDNYYKPSKITAVEGVLIQNQDIRDPSLNLSGFDVLFHLAAVSGIKTCEDDKEEAFDINVKGTFNLLKTFKGRTIFASTSAVYGQADEPTIHEESHISPRNHYGATKLQGEELVKLTNNYCILRFSNIYGKAMSLKRTVCDLFIENALKQEPLIIYGTGRQRRDFVHFRDVIKSYWNSMNSELNEILNIGGNQELNINDVASMVCECYRKNFGYIPQIKKVPMDGGPVWRDFTYDTNRAKIAINYKPQHCMEDEIVNRIAAHRKSRKK